MQIVDSKVQGIDFKYIL